MDLLGSILGTMQKPPTMGDEERKKAKGSFIFIFCSSNLFNQLSILINLRSIMKICTLTDEDISNSVYIKNLIIYLI